MIRKNFLVYAVKETRISATAFLFSTMAKDPAFLFYPGDWLGGTMVMSLEQKGAYITLLVFQFNNGRFSEADAVQLIGTENWLKIRSKMTKKNDLFYNKRLDEEILKRRKHSEHQRDNVNKRWEKRYYDGNTIVLPLENENENSIVLDDSNTKNGKVVKVDQGKKASRGRKQKKFEPPTEAEVREYFSINGYKPEAGSKAFRFYQTGGWIDSRGNPVKNWKQKMIAVWFKDENRAPPEVPSILSDWRNEMLEKERLQNEKKL